ncbi:hypothetical protein TOPH_03112 [Tolypocladium ophioglossoides CBS 100239]|uniref:Uncharacterized protein n=1 Tax=Tolypocladium ophioglossoides (strain CBS 100239) TaxID=1163406 RepID=A0A0L0NDL6_TOLOC|nr:hypothetical protein TOPH_03112 [Tolypocladium ophioglossoides CBS 100239]
MAPDEEKTPSRPRRLIKLILAGLVALYSVSNLVLFVLSCVAWSKAKDHASNDCILMGSVECGFTRWALYSLIAAAAMICFSITAVMAVSSVFRARGAPVDPLYVFRGIFFTLLLLAPIIYIGWSNLNVVLDDANAHYTMRAQEVICDEWGRVKPEFKDMQGYPDKDRACDMTDVNTGARFSGLGGAFILEVMDSNFLGTKAAFAMAHFNV